MTFKELCAKIETLVKNSSAFVSRESATKFYEMLKGCFRISYKLSDDSMLAIGTSKAGGRPDLPAGMEWPTYNGEPLTFICQINLQEVHASVVEHGNSKDGDNDKDTMLYFFVYRDKENSFSRRGTNKTIFSRDIKNLYRAEFPGSLETQNIFKPSAMKFVQSVSYPDNTSPSTYDMCTSWDAHHALLKKIDALIEDYHGDRINDRLFGYDQPLQSCLEKFWPIMFLGISTWDEVQKRRDEIEAMYSDYMLLLQIDIYANPSRMARGGSPVAYFGIRKDDFARRDFSDTIVAYQDT